MKDDLAHLKHIRECLAAIENYIGEDREIFFADRKTRQATIRELQELAESTTRLSPELKEKHPEVPWKAIAGFRNILVHDYLGLNLERIWHIIENDLAVLKKTIEVTLEELSESKLS